MTMLIITADDMGYSSVRDTGILQCWEECSITRASVLVNGVSAQEACRRAKEKSLPIGLHLNLTEGISISEHVPTLLIPHTQLPCSVFRGKLGFREALWSNLIDPEEIRKETEAQIEHFITFTGSAPRYVDGHQHIHVLPGVREVIASVMGKYGIRETRVPAENLTDCDWIDETRYNFYQEVSKQARESRCVWNKHGIRSTCAFVGMVTMGRDMSVERLAQRLTKTLQDPQKVYPTRESEDSTGNCTHESHYNTEGSTCESHFSLVKLKAKLANNQLPENENENSENTCLTTAPRIDQQNYQHFSVELMVHPGFPCPESENGGCGTGPDEFARSEERHHEMKVLSSKDFQEFLTAAGFEKHSCVQLKGTGMV